MCVLSSHENSINIIHMYIISGVLSIARMLNAILYKQEIVCPSTVFPSNLHIVYTKNYIVHQKNIYCAVNSTIFHIHIYTCIDAIFSFSWVCHLFEPSS